MAVAEIFPPTKHNTVADVEAAMLDALAYLFDAGRENDPELTMPRIKAILGASDKFLRHKHGSQTTHRFLLGY